MIDGVRLTLLIGPMVPMPAPRAVVDALVSAQVSTSNDRSGFQLVFAAGPSSPLLRTMLPSGFFDPMVTRVVLVATLRGVPTVLIDGVVTRHDLAPSNDPGASRLTITGEDLSVLMDVVEMPFMRYPAMPEVSQLYTILAKYAAFGVVPLVLPPVLTDTPSPTERIPTHSGTDLEYIKQTARRCGYVFFLDPGPAPGTSIAYFGPDVRVPLPQPALTVNMGAATNVESLSFGLDGTAKKVVVTTVYDSATHRQPIPIPLPNLSLLRPPLGARPVPPSRVEFMSEGAKLSATEAGKRALAMAFNASDGITGSGTLDVVRYGRILRARSLVGVRGVGIAYDGMYYVNSTTHDLSRGKYTQRFNLSRDGLVAAAPVVPV